MSSTEILTTVRNKVRTIVFNRPHKKNAITTSMYKQISNILNTDALDDNILITILTGTEDYYTSGNDFVDSMENQSEQETENPSLNFLKSLIKYPKLLIAVVNGPAFGIGVTSLALCDIVYASERATFQTPFAKLAICAEGCSSLLFPMIMGRSKASEMLFLNETITAVDAKECGLVSRIVKHEEIWKFTESLEKLGSLPVNSVKITKKLIMKDLEEKLLKRADEEYDGLKVCIDSEDFQANLLKVFTKKSKL